jgi:hypothetical protein
MSENLTIREGYAAMFDFLRGVYERTQSADLGVLLGGMSLLQDGSTADPAAWSDWEDAVRKVKEDAVSLDLKLHKDP